VSLCTLESLIRPEGKILSYIRARTHDSWILTRVFVAVLFTEYPKILSNYHFSCSVEARRFFFEGC